LLLFFTTDATYQKGQKISMICRALKNSSYTDFYLSAAPEGDDAHIEQVFRWAAKLIAEHRIETMVEKVYGRRGSKEKVRQIRGECLSAYGLDPATPFTFIEGTPICPSDLAGLQLWGVAADDASQRMVTTVETPAGRNGRLLVAADHRYFYLPSLIGVTDGNRLPASMVEQTENLFAIIERSLSCQGFRLNNVVRTWFYLANILKYYDRFNQVRNDMFQRAGILPQAMPASTGIQGCSGNEECLADILALATDENADISVTPVLQSGRQNSAHHYGSAFSRAIRLNHGKRKMLFISGTASIDAQGNTVHVGEPERQVKETLHCLDVLLQEQGLDFSHIQYATCYCKLPAIWDLYQTLHRRMKLPSFPLVPVLADVCRDELLIEIDAFASA